MINPSELWYPLSLPHRTTFPLPWQFISSDLWVEMNPPSLKLLLVSIRSPQQESCLATPMYTECLSLPEASEDHHGKAPRSSLSTPQPVLPCLLGTVQGSCLTLLSLPHITGQGFWELGISFDKFSVSLIEVEISAVNVRSIWLESGREATEQGSWEF